MKSLLKIKLPRRKYLIFIIYALIVLLALTWALTSSQSLKTLDNNYFSIKYPKNYHVRSSVIPDDPDHPDSGKVQFVMITKTAKELFDNSIYVVSEPAKQYKVEQSQEELLDALGGNSGQVNITHTEKTKIDGNEGAKVIFDRKLDGQRDRAHGVYVRTKKGSTIYSMTVTSVEKGSAFDKQVPAIVDSFKIK